MDNLALTRAARKQEQAEDDLKWRLEKLQRLAWNVVTPIGEGEEHRAMGDRTAASALTFDGCLVHGSAVIC